ncbi:unnamed protein product [Blepharisma stoltei]|uniref:SET domain-containing protein n=1 Tax=Blepharisma stoltei TaxID=1481888 RepID=A0AAU9KKA1_9CILI|nr:unnamed protein product [Blepharisma stoltei]
MSKQEFWKLAGNTYTKTENMNEDLSLSVNITIPRKMHKTSCSKCKNSRSSAVINCANCKKETHIACLDEKGVASCECCELPKKRGRKPTRNKALGNETPKNTIEHKDISKFAGLSLQEIVNKYLDEVADLDKNQYLGEDQEDQCTKKLKIEDSSNGSLNGFINDGFRIKPQGKKKEKRTTRRGRKATPSFPGNDKTIRSLDCLKNFAHLYFSAEQVKKDLSALVDYKLSISKDENINRSISNVWINAKKILKNYNEFLWNALVHKWSEILKNTASYPTVLGEWNKTNYSTRKYEIIQDYEPADDTYNTSMIMTEKIGECDGIGCDTKATLGIYDIGTCRWQSTNKDRAENMECSEKCKCDAETCKNRQIANRDYLSLENDLKETPTWGFDIQTRLKIVYLLGDPSDKNIKIFINKALPKAINLLENSNWKITEVLISIGKNEKNIFTDSDKLYAKKLWNAIEALRKIDEKAIENSFRIHPKGTGALCLREKGIEKGSLIHEYLGEIFTSAKWYERQDVIKQIRKEKIQAKEISGSIPDFYNIYLERHKEDPAGYDIFMIDPMLKGNFASRLSHSCNPNCGTVTMISGGKYTVGMYALKNISYLDELTFDYNSVTESILESRNSVCLCCNMKCRSYYVSLAKTSMNSIRSHNFLQRVSRVLQCVDRNFDEDLEKICYKSHIKSAVLDGCPEWLKVWIALVAQDIDTEIKDLQTKMIEEDYQSTFESRLQNLVISVSKIKYILSKTESYMPPLKMLNEQEAFNYLWGDEEFSVRSQLLSYRWCKNSPIDKALRKKCLNLDQARRHLLKIRDILRSKDKNQRVWKNTGIADMLHLIAYTQLFFTINEYPEYHSEDFTVSLCEVSKEVMDSAPLNEKYHRTYSSTYILEVLFGWYKQKIGEKNNAFTKEMKGTLCLSSISRAIESEYSETARKNLWSHIEKKPFSSWKNIKSESHPWTKSFNNKILGSPMFDSFYSQTNALKECVDSIDLPAKKCEIPDYANI